MHTLKWLLATLLIITTGGWVVTESNQLINRPPTTITVLGSKATVLNVDDFAKFRKQIMPLINEMARRKVVSLGEGTHGTSEFYKIRYWITKILVEEKGFTHIAFENDYADSYQLDQALKQGRTDYEPLMKQYLISIWRNREVETLLRWMQQYNKTYHRSVSFGGLDIMFMTNDAKVIQQLTTPLKNPQLSTLSDQLVRLATFRDSLWYSANRKNFTVADTLDNGNFVKAYETVAAMQQILNGQSLPTDQMQSIMNLIENVKLQCEGAYNWVKFKKPGGGRDSSMAVMATRIVQKPTDKLIIWAHDAHVARQSMYSGAVGGMGGFIERKLPGQYFVLGTGTANGTFAATDDQFITHASIMRSVTLETPADSLWEAKLARLPASALYVNGRDWRSMNTNLPNRVIGYRSGSGKGNHDKSHPLNQMYDAYLFVRDTKAAQFIP